MMNGLAGLAGLGGLGDGGLDAVLRRAEQLVQNAETWPPEPNGDLWPPEQPPAKPLARPAQAAQAGIAAQPAGYASCYSNGVHIPATVVEQALWSAAAPSAAGPPSPWAAPPSALGPPQALGPLAPAVPLSAPATAPGALERTSTASAPAAPTAPTAPTASAVLAPPADPWGAGGRGARPSTPPATAAASARAGALSTPGGPGTAAAAPAGLAGLAAAAHNRFGAGNARPGGGYLPGSPGAGLSCSSAAGAASPAPSGSAIASGISGCWRGAEAAVLVDGLERENALLRQQLERCFTREKALRAETEELRLQLQAIGRREQLRREAESAAALGDRERWRDAAQRQGEIVQTVAARLEALQGQHENQDVLLADLQLQVTSAEAEVTDFTRELEELQRFVLPRAPVEVPETFDPRHLAGPPLKAALRHARRALGALRLACEAKLDTLEGLRRELRRPWGPAPPTAAALAAAALPAPHPRDPRSLEGAPSGSAPKDPGPACLPSPSPEIPLAPPAPPIPSLAALESSGQSGPSGPSGPSGSASASGAALAQLRADLEQARREAVEERQRSASVTRRLAGQESDYLALARELDTVRRELRVKEAEVRELQLLGKYFAGAKQRPPSAPELAAAELAEDLRLRCSRLTEELRQARAERDLLRAERAGGEAALLGHSRASRPCSGVGALGPGAPGCGALGAFDSGSAALGSSWRPLSRGVPADFASGALGWSRAGAAAPEGGVALALADDRPGAAMWSASGGRPPPAATL